MNSLITLFISGDMYLFDNDITPEQLSQLTALAKDKTLLCTDLSKVNSQDIFNWFIDEAKLQLGIILHQVKIDSIIRINK